MIESDKRQDSPKPVEDILNAISKIPIPGLSYFVSAIRWGSEKRREENIELMQKTVWEELKRVSIGLDDLGEGRR